METVRFNATVIYPKGSLRSGADPSLSHHRSEDRRMEIEIEADKRLRWKSEANTRALLDIVYRYMNHVDASECERQLQQYQERSMMVGDLIELFGKTYKCDIVGWLEVN